MPELVLSAVRATSKGVHSVPFAAIKQTLSPIEDELTRLMRGWAERSPLNRSDLVDARQAIADIAARRSRHHEALPPTEKDLTALTRKLEEHSPLSPIERAIVILKRELGKRRPHTLDNFQESLKALFTDSETPPGTFYLPGKDPLDSTPRQVIFWDSANWSATLRPPSHRNPRPGLTSVNYFTDKFSPSLQQAPRTGTLSEGALPYVDAEIPIFEVAPSRKEESRGEIGEYLGTVFPHVADQFGDTPYPELMVFDRNYHDASNAFNLTDPETKERLAAQVWTALRNPFVHGLHFAYPANKLPT